jgi:urea carboxylase
MIEIASKTIICGPRNNLDFMVSIMNSPEFISGNTITNFLGQFMYSPTAIDVLSGGAYTLIQDYPGRPTLGHGFGHAGPMDSITFQIANGLVGNDVGTEALEITLSGPDLKFLGDAIISLCGPLFEAHLDQDPFPLWASVHVRAGQILRVGRCLANGGCRAYLAVRGGFTNIGKWFGSKATCPGVGIGGYQGRAIKAGDFLSLSPIKDLPVSQAVVPESARPNYSAHWDIAVMYGPFEDGYLQQSDNEMVYSTKWKVSHNAARGGVRLIGPRPKWARSDGGEGGSHPSNVIEYGYPIGGLNWTGDEPVILPMDGPDFGGFACSLTIIEAELWKVGQLKPGDTLMFHRVSLEDSLERKRGNIKYLQDLTLGIKANNFNGITPPATQFLNVLPTQCLDSTVVRYIEETTSRPSVTYRQGGDSYMLVEYGSGSFDLNHKCRATTLTRQLRAGQGQITFETGLLNIVGCGNSLQIYYDGLKIPQSKLVEYLVSLEDQLGDLRDIKLPNRTFWLPLTFTHAKITEALERYMSNQRPYASYLPNNLDFLARNNGISHEELKCIFLEGDLVAVSVGFMMALPLCLPADPRHRVASPKMNPSRTFTPEGAVSWGGSCMAMYNADGPGGYMLAGMSIPGVDVLGFKNGYSEDRPWLFEDMDVIKFYEVTEEEYNKDMALWKSGRYEYRVEDTVFDMAHHNELLKETAGEVDAMRTRQKVHQDEMTKLEIELLVKWEQERAADKPPLDKLDRWLNGKLKRHPTPSSRCLHTIADPNYVTIDSPVNANVWKVQVKDGETLHNGTVAAILEAMKLEINIMADVALDGCIVEKVLVQPGDSIEAGNPILVGRKVIPT